MEKISFAKICEVEPILKVYAYKAGKIRKSKKHTDTELLDLWYEFFKPVIAERVGFSRTKGPEWMQSCEAYDIAYETILDLLGA